MSSKNFMSYDDATTVLSAYAEAIKNKQNALTTGDYIDITNNKISVNRELIPQVITYNLNFNTTYKCTVKKYSGEELISTNTYNFTVPNTYTIDDAFTLASPDYNTGWVYTLLKDSTEHQTGYSRTIDPFYDHIQFSESFPTEDLSGYKLVIKHEMDSALVGKQDALTAGDDIKINNDEISVEVKIPICDNYAFSVNAENGFVITKTHDGVETTATYPSGMYETYTVDDLFTLTYDGNWTITLLVASTEYPAGQSWSSGYLQPPAIASLDFVTSYNTGTASEFIEDLQDEVAEKLPTAPTTDGAYVLTVTVASGTPTYSWESAT